VTSGQIEITSGGASKMGVSSPPTRGGEYEQAATHVTSAYLHIMGVEGRVNGKVTGLRTTFVSRELRVRSHKVRVAIVTFVLAFAICAIARAESIVVVADDPAFRSAVTEALVDSRVQLATDAAPQSIGEMTTASRAIVVREHATAMVWLMFEGTTATLIVYDLAADRVLVRTLPYAAPLGGVQAAEAARVTRTMLTALRIPEAPKPPPPPPPVVVEPVRVVVPPPAPVTLAIDVDGGVRVRGPGATAALAGTFGVIWRPDRLGLGLAVRIAPSATLDGQVTGKISDQSVGLVARWPLPVTRRFDVVTTGGVALHRIALDGMVLGEPVRDRRIDPALRIGALASYLFNSSIALGVGVSADWLLRRQTYEVGPDEVVTVPIIQLAVGLVLSARIL
jgi:hypothetical protein